MSTQQPLLKYDDGTSVRCDGWCGDHHDGITHIDDKGYIYCAKCGPTRRTWRPCRKLRPHELNRIRRGQQVTRY